MSEIEVKILEIDKKKVKQKLLALGAKKVGEGEQHTIIFDYPDSRLEKQRAFLRLRRKYGKSFVTYKKHVSGKKVRVSDEKEFNVDDFEFTEKLLLGFGLEKKGDFKSKRTTYKIGKTIFEIDEYLGVPAYMEIEVPKKETINEFIKKFGFDKNKVKTWSGKKLFAHYGKKFY